MKEHRLRLILAVVGKGDAAGVRDRIGLLLKDPSSKDMPRLLDAESVLPCVRACLNVPNLQRNVKARAQVPDIRLVFSCALPEAVVYMHGVYPSRQLCQHQKQAHGVRAPGDADKGVVISAKHCIGFNGALHLLQRSVHQDKKIGRRAPDLSSFKTARIRRITWRHPHS